MTFFKSKLLPLATATLTICGSFNVTAQTATQDFLRGVLSGVLDELTAPDLSSNPCVGAAASGFDTYARCQQQVFRRQGWIATYGSVENYCNQIDTFLLGSDFRSCAQVVEKDPWVHPSVLRACNASPFHMMSRGRCLETLHSKYIDKNVGIACQNDMNPVSCLEQLSNKQFSEYAGSRCAKSSGFGVISCFRNAQSEEINGYRDLIQRLYNEALRGSQYSDGGWRGPRTQPRPYGGDSWQSEGRTQFEVERERLRLEREREQLRREREREQSRNELERERLRIERERDRIQSERGLGNGQQGTEMCEITNSTGTLLSSNVRRRDLSNSFMILAMSAKEKCFVSSVKGETASRSLYNNMGTRLGSDLTEAQIDGLKDARGLKRCSIGIAVCR